MGLGLGLLTVGGGGLRRSRRGSRQSARSRGHCTPHAGAPGPDRPSPEGCGKAVEGAAPLGSAHAEAAARASPSRSWWPRWCSSGPSSWRWSSPCPAPPARWRSRRSSPRSRSVRWSAATCGWTATSPSRASCSSPACSGERSSPPARPWCSRASAVAGGATERDALDVVAPVTEEVTKGAFLLLLLWWRRHELDGVLDGIVYAGMVGIGFAFTENILYLAAAYNGTDGLGPGGIEALTGDLRAALPVQPVRAPAVHRVHRHRRRHRRHLAPAARSGSSRRWSGYALAAVLHGALERLDRLRHRPTSSSSTAADGPGVPRLVAFAVSGAGPSGRCSTRALQDAADRGLMPATDIPWLVDLRARRHARRCARHQGGPQAERAMRDYQQAAVELGFLHHRYLRGTAPPDFSARGQEHVEELRSDPPLHRLPRTGGPHAMTRRRPATRPEQATEPSPAAHPTPRPRC